MSASRLFLAAVSVRAVSVHPRCFAPFEKWGYGGFAFRVIEEQEQIPLDPPFSKGEKKLHRVAATFPYAGESSMQVTA
ncbi:MAG: hypothetical protein ABI858_01340 [Pseudoxanthomonas sp.]